jgi:hypothetical protein
MEGVVMVEEPRTEYRRLKKPFIVLLYAAWFVAWLWGVLMSVEALYIVENAQNIQTMIFGVVLYVALVFVLGVAFMIYVINTPEGLGSWEWKL